MEMIAKVLEVRCCELLVCDLCSLQEVIVHTPLACCFSAGDRVCICFDGRMTLSIPPQITAINIVKLPLCGCRC